MKECSKCHQNKSFESFSKSSKSKSGYKSECKDCAKKNYKPKPKEKAIEQAKRYKSKNPEKYKEQWKRYYERNKEKIAKKASIKNSDPHVKQRIKEYKERTRERERYRKKKRRENMTIEQKLEKKIRDRFNKVIVRMKKGVKHCSSLKLIGCTIMELKEHIESQFIDGMDWGNHGLGEHKWNIDHIKPLHTFDLTKLEEQEKAFHYTNLRPLWSIDNFKRKENKPYYYRMLNDAS